MDSVSVFDFGDGIEREIADTTARAAAQSAETAAEKAATKATEAKTAAESATSIAQSAKAAAESADAKADSALGKMLTNTLAAGATTLTFSDDNITTNSTIDVYTDIYGITPSDIAVSAGKVTLTFKAQSSNVGVKIKIS